MGRTGSVCGTVQGKLKIRLQCGKASRAATGWLATILEQKAQPLEHPYFISAIFSCSLIFQFCLLISN